MKAWIYFFLISLAIFLASSFFTACGDDDDDDATTGDDDDVDDDDADDDAVDDDTDDDDTDDDADTNGWSWQAVAESICRDGTTTGIGVRATEGADKLVIFIEGGGACYSADSCADNPESWSEQDFLGWAAETGGAGIFNTDNVDNPVGGWNFIYIPYCTGDVHVGSMPDGVPPGLTEAQQFLGYANITAFLQTIPTVFPGQTKVLLAGLSAGGFGAYFNYPQVSDAFAPTPVILLDDSGPIPDSDAVLSPCYQLQLRYLWNADPMIADGCTDCLDTSGDGFSEWATYNATTYTSGFFGLISYLEDSTIRDFFGMGQDDCTGTTLIPADTFSAGLIQYRDDVLAPTGKWGTFYIDGEDHTIIDDEALFTGTTVAGTAFTDWLADLIEGTVAQVSP